MTLIVKKSPGYTAGSRMRFRGAGSTLMHSTTSDAAPTPPVDWSPTDLGAALIGWWKADAGIVYNPDPNIQQWQDSSGNNNHLTAPYGGVYPLFAPDMTSIGAVYFDTTDLMYKTFPAGQSQPILLFIGAIWQTEYDAATCIFDGMGGATIINMYKEAGSEDVIARVGETYSGHVPSTDAWCVYELLLNGANSALAIDGGVRTAASLDSTNLGGIMLGSNQDMESPMYANTAISEVLLCNSDVSEPTRQSAVSYLRTRAGF